MGSLPGGGGKARGLRDFAAIPDWAKPSVTLLSRIKWLSGFPDGTYRPEGILTRAQAAKILAKYLGL